MGNGKMGNGEVDGHRLGGRGGRKLEGMGRESSSPTSSILLLPINMIKLFQAIVCISIIVHQQSLVFISFVMNRTQTLGFYR